MDEPARIDERAQKLVRVLNAVAGVETYSSCGGHENPDLGQVPADEFTVSFDVEPTAEGWAALDRIAWASGELEWVTVSAWFNAEVGVAYEPGALSFNVSGVQHADPDELARLIESVL